MSDFFWNYDPTADVLHIVLDPSTPAFGEPLRNFEDIVILMKDVETDEVVGIRILGAKANKVGDIVLLINRERSAFEGLMVSGDPEALEEQQAEFLEELKTVDEILSKPPEDFAEKELLHA